MKIVSLLQVRKGVVLAGEGEANRCVTQFPTLSERASCMLCVCIIEPHTQSSPSACGQNRRRRTRRLRSSLLELISFSLAGGCAFVVRVTLQWPPRIGRLRPPAATAHAVRRTTSIGTSRWCENCTSISIRECRMGCQISKNPTPVRDLRIPMKRRRLLCCCVHPERR